jgi:glycosyltransferase involved in cell wall biosynthesis
VRACAVTSVHPVFDARIFHKECRSLARAGFDVSLVAPHDRNETVDGVKIVAIPRIGKRFQRAVIGPIFALRKALEVDARIYHFHDPELIPAGLFLRAKGKLVIFDAHEDYPKAMLSKPYIPRWSRPAAAWSAEGLARLARASFSALVSATPSIAKGVGGTTQRHIIVQNFPDMTEFDLRGQGVDEMWSRRELSVAYVGGISEIRGIVEILEALARIPERLPVSLALAGSFDPEGLQRRLEQHPAWARVQWLGQLPRAEVAALLGRVRAGLVLFKDEPNHVTAYPTKMFEYMAAGIPVIASDFPLWRQIVEEAECGVVADPADSDAIARAIEHVVTHEAEAARMGCAGFEAVTQRYNWLSEEAKLIKLYRDLSGECRPGAS